MKFKSKAHMVQELIAGKRFLDTESRDKSIIYYDPDAPSPFRYGNLSMAAVWNRFYKDIWQEIESSHVHQDLIDSYKEGQAWQYKEAHQAAWHNSKNADTWMSPVWNETTEYRLHYHNDLIQEFNAGADIEFFDDYHNKWVSASSPTWDEGTKYRIKAKTKTVYEWMACYDGKWRISGTVMTEAHAAKCFNLAAEYQKTGRSFEVPA
jgi:hypothetical protein